LDPLNRLFSSPLYEIAFKKIFYNLKKPLMSIQYPGEEDGINYAFPIYEKSRKEG
jgi:hypothetical protein